jgi:hypothetical protein
MSPVFAANRQRRPYFWQLSLSHTIVVKGITLHY